jgi:hypothetical protein
MYLAFPCIHSSVRCAADFPVKGAAKRSDENRLNKVLATQEFAVLPVVGGLLEQFRKDILFARKALATDRQLDEKARPELWDIIDAREWFLGS